MTRVFLMEAIHTQIITTTFRLQLFMIMISKLLPKACQIIKKLCYFDLLYCVVCVLSPSFYCFYSFSASTSIINKILIENFVICYGIMLKCAKQPFPKVKRIFDNPDITTWGLSVKRGTRVMSYLENIRIVRVKSHKSFFFSSIDIQYA